MSRREAESFDSENSWAGDCQRENCGGSNRALHSAVIKPFGYIQGVGDHLKKVQQLIVKLNLSSVINMNAKKKPNSEGERKGKSCKKNFGEWGH